MFTFSEMLALVQSESSFGAFVFHRRPAGLQATSDLVARPAACADGGKKLSDDIQGSACAISNERTIVWLEVHVESSLAKFTQLSFPQQVARCT